MKMKTTIKDVHIGSKFRFGQIEFVKLDTLTNGCLCLATDVLFKNCFDESNKNNWEISSLRQKLAEVIGDYICKNALIPFYRDLTTDDGLTDYGSCADSVSMLTCNEYRKYRKFIPKIEEWYWTITADSPEYSNFIRFVLPDGSLDNYDTYFGNGGVRPLICLNNRTLVEVENAKDKG